MKEVETQGDLAGNGLYIGRLMRPSSGNHCCTIRQHNGEHKTQVSSIWAIMLKVIQQFDNMCFARMV